MNTPVPIAPTRHRAVTPKNTEAIEDYPDGVPASEAVLEGYCDIAYRIKPEFRQYFPSDE